MEETLATTSFIALIEGRIVPVSLCPEFSCIHVSIRYESLVSQWLEQNYIATLDNYVGSLAR
jgi:hypothetical protein